MREPLVTDRCGPPEGSRGMTTAEYATGTVAVVVMVGVLVAVLADPSAPVRLFWPILRQLFDAVLRALGVVAP